MAITACNGTKLGSRKWNEQQYQFGGAGSETLPLISTFRYPMHINSIITYLSGLCS